MTNRKDRTEFEKWCYETDSAGACPYSDCDEDKCKHFYNTIQKNLNEKDEEIKLLKKELGMREGNLDHLREAICVHAYEDSFQGRAHPHNKKLLSVCHVDEQEAKNIYFEYLNKAKG